MIDTLIVALQMPACTNVLPTELHQIQDIDSFWHLCRRGKPWFLRVKHLMSPCISHLIALAWTSSVPRSPVPSGQCLETFRQNELHRPDVPTSLVVALIRDPSTAFPICYSSNTKEPNCPIAESKPLAIPELLVRSCLQREIPTRPSPYPEHLHHLVTKVVDDLDGNAARLRPVEWAGRVAVQGSPRLLVYLGLETCLE